MISKDMQSLSIVLIVGLVAVVGVLILLLNAGSAGTGASAVGAVVTVISPEVTSYSFWTTCLDQGNQVKLGNKEGDVLVKKDACTGSVVQGKQIADASCVGDADGGFSYKYSNAEDCSTGTKCLLDENGAAYCA